MSSCFYQHLGCRAIDSERACNSIRPNHSAHILVVRYECHLPTWTHLLDVSRPDLHLPRTIHFILSML